jgi:response regulator RpfG family c-di-GMP phosphodiesterase
MVPDQIPEDEQARAYRANVESLIAKRTDDLRHAMVELETSHNVALDALVSMLGLHDPQSEAHSKRVVAYTVGIANALGAAPEHARVFAQAAYLHDIGNVAVHAGSFCKKAS